MEVTFADSFFKSLKKISKHNTWWFKIYHFLRYDILRLFRNIWQFRKEMFNFHPWDHSFNEAIFKRSLELTANYLEKYGIEMDEMRNKKIKSIKRTIELFDHDINDDFLEQAEEELNIELISKKSFLLDDLTEEEHEINMKLIEKSNKIKEQQWEELWSIIKGHYNKENQAYLFDGSDIRTWWD